MDNKPNIDVNLITPEIVKKVLGQKNECTLDPYKKCDYCGECLLCDLDPKKICNNCGKCLDEFNTDEKGFVKVAIDKVEIQDKDAGLEELLKQYGLDGEDDE